MALKLCLRSGEKFQQLKHLLLLQRFRVWLLATTWKFTTICNPNSRRSSTLSDFHCTRHTCVVLLASLQLHYLYHSLSFFLSYTNTEKHWLIIITFRLRKMFMKSITSSSKKMTIKRFILYKYMLLGHARVSRNSCFNSWNSLVCLRI